MKKRQRKKNIRKLHPSTCFKSKLEKKQYILNSKKWDEFLANNINPLNRDNSIFVLGKTMPGKTYHPWDNLKLCKKCGHYPYMEGKSGLYEVGKANRIICLYCGRKIEFIKDVGLLKKKWNNIN